MSSKWPSQRPSSRPSARPSSRPSSRPSQGPSYEFPSHSIHPSQPRNRAILAGVCLALFGMLVVSAFVRTCEGDDTWGPPKQQRAPAEAPAQP